jgi:regulator of protease activity HflC (stomatin/prohibitin superfamily)
MNYENAEMKTSTIVGIILIALFLIFGGIGGCMWGYPQYTVYKQRLVGEAELAQANYSKQVAVQEAVAKRDAAKMLAEAEVQRAIGVAKANKIIGDSLHNNEDYLRYLFVNGLENTQNQVIYVPTETNLPILEAARMQPR